MSEEEAIWKSGFCMSPWFALIASRAHGEVVPSPKLVPLKLRLALLSVKRVPLKYGMELVSQVLVPRPPFPIPNMPVSKFVPIEVVAMRFPDASVARSALEVAFRVKVPQMLAFWICDVDEAKRPC